MHEVPDQDPIVEKRPPVQENDPYPRMIIVCIGIALVLVTIIFGFIFFDLISQRESGVRPVRPAATQPLDLPAGD